VTPEPEQMNTTTKKPKGQSKKAAAKRPKAPVLDKFYAVTRTSLYELTHAKGEGIATKIAMRDNSRIAVGERLEGGPVVSVGEQLITFVPEKYGPASPMAGFEYDIANVNTRYWGVNSSSIIALFTSKRKAQACLRHDDGVIKDPRWIDETKEVIRCIGPDNHMWSVTRSPRLALFTRDELDQIWGIK
jgi:hypothetical protein